MAFDQIKNPFEGVVLRRKLVTTPKEVVHPSKPKKSFVSLRSMGKYGIQYIECQGQVLYVGASTPTIYEEL